ncbi:hypothetical protein N4T77_05950 [Clostridium sp. CX1]|uniref:hypothetical protein n=1 Tax=Clostridium sp. CX1 TaxID=2978346 RepID=UPI0021C1C57E|nr:hypothetical protein [Clostridium sp. CX1]MCT8976136.1 hypothetical protein [Clostridium sp. CX1]
MEYRLNKVDPELRQRIKETTKPGKIHNKAEIAVNTDSKNKNKKDGTEFSSELEKQKKEKEENKKKITIEAVKLEEVNIPAFKEPESSKDEMRGNILDVRK